MLHTITYAATCAGMKQKDIFYDNQEYQRALKMTYDKVGYPDCSYNISPGTRHLEKRFLFEDQE